MYQYFSLYYWDQKKIIKVSIQKRVISRAKYGENDRKTTSRVERKMATTANEQVSEETNDGTNELKTESGRIEPN